MSRPLHKLKARTVETTTTPGRHSDGGGLYLVVDKSGAKRWVYLFSFGGKLKEMGLGGVNGVSLAKAREAAAEARALVADGVNPIAARRQTKAKPTFGEVADAVIADQSPGWSNDKHIAQWKMTLKVYAAPLREKPVDEITTDDVLAVLRPIWTIKAETAHRVQGRIERVLEAAKVRGYRDGDNPARWRGHLDHLLPRKLKLNRGHHPAMPYPDVPAFMERVRAVKGMGAKALEFTILTAVRTSEALEATWDEIDLSEKLWVIPAARMKARKEHRVPLSPRAIELLEELNKGRVSDLVFPGIKDGRPLSNMTMDKVLRGLAAECTVHGFRSSFRDWAAEETPTPREIAEAALAHAVGDRTERAYRRGDALQKRRTLMDTWATYLGGTCEPAGD